MINFFHYQTLPEMAMLPSDDQEEFTYIEWPEDKHDVSIVADVEVKSTSSKFCNKS